MPRTGGHPAHPNASCCYPANGRAGSMITKDPCTHSTIFLRQEKILRDHLGWGGASCWYPTLQCRRGHNGQRGGGGEVREAEAEREGGGRRRERKGEAERQRGGAG